MRGWQSGDLGGREKCKCSGEEKSDWDKTGKGARTGLGQLALKLNATYFSKQLGTKL